MMLFRIVKYLRYLLFSGHARGHGIHSPFIFDLICRIFRNKTCPDVVNKIEEIRKKMKKSSLSLYVNDFGSGSRRIHSRLRKISDIANHSAVPARYGKLLYRMSENFGSTLIIEFGTSLGISTMYLAAGSPSSVLYTIEGCTATSEIAFNNFKETGLENIKILNGPFDKMLPFIESLKTSPGLVFIDGDHGKESVIRYFNFAAGISDNNSVVILDDIYYSREMAEAWNIIKEHDKVSVTIDIFRMGIVFFRKGLSSYNYTLRY